jgi:hypothetical protein
VQNAIDLAFIEKLWVFRLDGLELNGHFFTCGHVRPKIDVTERTATDLPTEAVFLSNTKLHPPMLSAALLQRSYQTFVVLGSDLFK